MPKMEEDGKAKQMLQGIWLNDDAGDVAFKIQGDTVFYPDTTSLPTSFKVIGDTMILYGAKDTKYPIQKLSSYIFVFVNQNGEQVKLVKSEDTADDFYFEGKNTRPLNQNRLIKRDTVVVQGGEKFHCYVQVNPTTFKVIKPSYNDDGVAVDNVYHDNIIHLSVFRGASKVYSGDFRKQQFKHYVPKDILECAILSDMLFSKIDNTGIHYIAVLGMGDSKLSYEIDLTVGFDGCLSICRAN